MELYDEDYYQKSRKKSKLPIIIGVIIGVLTVLTIAIIYLIIYLNSTVMKIHIDGTNKSEIEKILYIKETETVSKLYIPVRAIAKYLNYEDYSGDYKNKSEDSSKCYVKNEFETAMFTLNSDKIVKTIGDSDYEYVTIDEKVFEQNGQLYTTIDGVKKAFNVEFLYDSDKKQIDIFTMDYLVNYYTAKLNIEKYSEEFNDKKAIFENMIITTTENEDEFGVVNATTGSSILESKYKKISYLPNTKDFLVENNDKYGILTKDGATKAKIVYEEIEIMDNQNGLYLIKQNDLYGVMDTNGKIILEPEYDTIGVDLNDFEQNGIENKYILLDKLIPVEKDNLWGFFNLKGEKVTDLKYTELGCKTSKVPNSYPLLVIPSRDIIVVEKDNMYNLMKANGKELINGYLLEDVYLKANTETGESTFYMTYGGKTEDIEKKLDSLGIE